MKNLYEREKQYLCDLSLMIQKETISSDEVGENNISKFLEFHELLRQIFPNLFSHVKYENFDGSMLLKWEGKDKSKFPALFMNHMDVVEVSGKWEHEAFSGDVDEERIWGRGTLDNKGGLFAMLKAADELITEGFVPSRDIFFESSCNEETTGKGADLISQTLEARNIKFDVVFDEGGMIMREPIAGAKGMFAMVAMGEKGCCDLKFSAVSDGGHASAPPKDSPLIRLAKFMVEVEKKDPFQKEIGQVTKEMFLRLSPYMKKGGFLMKHIGFFAPLVKWLLPRLSPTAGAMIKTTIAFTMAEGSKGTNVLPQEAWVIGNMRFSHHEGREESIKKIATIAEKYNIKIAVLDEGIQSPIADCNSKYFNLIERAAKEAYPELEAAIPYIMTGASDARFFNRFCSNCYRFLPFLIDEAQLQSIHGINENLYKDNLIPAVDYYKILMREI